jgi:hypothetical protein
MNAPLRHPLTPSEVDAHLSILETIEDAQDGDLPYRVALMRFQVPLETFAPRCNCGHRLRFSPWLDGLRVAKCERCGWKSLESPL